MFGWKTGNIGSTLIGLWYLILPFLASQSMNQSMMLFGFTFLAIGIVRASSRPTVLGCVSAMLIGLAYFFGLTGGIGGTILWPLSIALFALVAVFEFGIIRFGPANAKAKILLIVPLAVMGFTLLLGFAGYNPMIRINWSAWMITFNYLAVMMFCWIYVLDVASWRPFKGRTTLILNLMALTAVGLSVLGMAQGSLFQW